MKILRLPEVITLVGFRRSTMYALIKTGGFPRPVALSPRVKGWLADEIDAWIRQRVEESRKAAQVA